MTKVQEDVLNTFDPAYWILKTDEYDRGDGYVDVEVIAECDATLYRYTIDPSGDTTVQTLAVSNTTSYYGWSMEEHDWMIATPEHKEAGDEPFDKAVEKIIIEENKMKEIKEKIMARFNFDDLAKEVMESAFEDYVRDNKQTLVEYAEESAKEKLTEHVNDNVDFEELAMNTIDEILDCIIEYDMPDIGDAAEEIISRYIFD